MRASASQCHTHTQTNNVRAGMQEVIMVYQVISVSTQEALSGEFVLGEVRLPKVGSCEGEHNNRANAMQYLTATAVKPNTSNSLALGVKTYLHCTLELRSDEVSLRKYIYMYIACVVRCAPFLS